MIQDSQYGICENQTYIKPVFEQIPDQIIKFNNYPVARITDEQGKLLGYADHKGFYYFEN